MTHHELNSQAGQNPEASLQLPNVNSPVLAEVFREIALQNERRRGLVERSTGLEPLAVIMAQDPGGLGPRLTDPADVRSAVTRELDELDPALRSRG